MSYLPKAADTLTANQHRAVSSLGESHLRLPDAVPHRLIAGPMKALRYKPEPWHVPIR